MCYTHHTLDDLFHRDTILTERKIMPKRFKMTRRFPVSITEDGYRNLRSFAREAGLTEGEALSFFFENLTSVTHTEKREHRLKVFLSTL